MVEGFLKPTLPRGVWCVGAEAAPWKLPRGGRAVPQGWDSFSLGLWGKKPEHHKFCCCEVNEGWTCPKCHLWCWLRDHPVHPLISSPPPSLLARLLQATKLVLQKDFPSGKVKCFFFWVSFLSEEGEAHCQSSTMDFPGSQLGWAGGPEPALIPAKVSTGWWEAAERASCSSGRGWISCLLLSLMCSVLHLRRVGDSGGLGAACTSARGETTAEHPVQAGWSE